MTQPTCPCGVPVDGATLCTDCRDALEVSLVNIGAYAEDLDTVLAKQTRYGTSAGGGSAGREIPLPLDLRATDAAWHARNVTSTWARIVLDEMPPNLGPVCHIACLHTTCNRARRSRAPVDSVPAATRYLVGWADYLRVSPHGPEVLDEMRDCERQLRKVVDRPAERWYAGACSALLEDGGRCGAELYARNDRGEITCPDCRTVHDVQARREFLLNEAEHMLVTASEAARAVVVWTDYDRGENRLVRRIGAWKDRGRIEERGHMREMGIERPMYRLGDVLDLLADDLRRDTHTGAGAGRSA